MQRVRRRVLLQIALLMHMPALVAACGGGAASPTSAPVPPTQAPAKPTVLSVPTSTSPTGAPTVSAGVPTSAPTGSSASVGSTVSTPGMGAGSSPIPANTVVATNVSPTPMAALPPAGSIVVAVTPAGIASAAAPAAQAAQAPIPNCVLTPAMAEGPYFVDEKLNRSDIRSDPSNGTVKPGALLTMTLRVFGVSGTACAPVAGAQVDIWQCDALGVYSDAIDRTFNTKGQKFLRGHQLSDASGNVTFQTIYPGWYGGRATHIHFKVRTEPTTAGGKELSSQLFMDDALNTRIYTNVAPYSTRGDRGRTTNAQDGIFRQDGGQLLLKISNSGDTYTATFDLGLKLA